MMTSEGAGQGASLPARALRDAQATWLAVRNGTATDAQERDYQMQREALRKASMR